MNSKICPLLLFNLQLLLVLNNIMVHLHFSLCTQIYQCQLLCKTLFILNVPFVWLLSLLIGLSTKPGNGDLWPSKCCWSETSITLSQHSQPIGGMSGAADQHTITWDPMADPNVTVLQRSL